MVEDSEYEPIPLSASIQGATICRRCGALVWNQTVHNTWHFQVRIVQCGDMRETATEKLTAHIATRRSLPRPEMRRAIRKAAGASLQDIADTFEPPVSRHAVMSWERGTRNPSPDNVQQYVAILRALQGV